MFLYPMNVRFEAHLHVETVFEIPVGWYDETGVFQAYDLAGRTLVFKARAPDAGGASLVIDSSTDNSTCAPKSGATDTVEIVIPSDVIDTLAAGSYACAVVDVTDAGTNAENLILTGTLKVSEQAVW